MIADFMTYRGISIMIARLADAGNWPLLVSATAQSITQDYAWGPALVPGLAAGADRAGVAGDLYVRAACALRRAGAASRWRSWRATSPAAPACAAQPRVRARLALGVAAVFVAFPAAIAVTARGMPDVGGLALAVCALRLAERLARLLALRQGHDARIAPMTRRVALALALTLFAMFAFRRWYAFAAAGIAIMLACRSRVDCARQSAGAVPLEGRLRRRRAWRSRAARALEPGHRRLAAEPGRA